MKLEMQKDLVRKIVIAGIIGTVAIITIAIILMMSLGNKPKQKPKSTVETDKKIETNIDEESGKSVIDSKEYVRTLGLVKSVDSVAKTIEVYEVINEILVTLNVDSSVIIEDEYGQPLVLDSLTPGYMINVKYDKSNYKLESVKIAAQVQTITKPSTFIVDDIKETVQIGSDTFKYNDKTMVLDNGESIDIKKLSTKDDLVIRAYQGNIWSILLNDGHGYIILKNQDSYIDGLLEIGNRTSYPITKDMKIAVSAGTHKIIITKEDMSPYTETVFVKEDEEYTIDLINLQPKESEVSFVIKQDGTTVYIDGEELTTYDEVVKLDYGSYEVTAINDDYDDYKGQLLVNKPSMTYTVELNSKPYYLYMNGPSGADFYIDGIFQTKLGGEVVTVPVSLGTHLLSLRKEGFNSWSQNIQITENKREYYYTIPVLPSENSVKEEEKEELPPVIQPEKDDDIGGLDNDNSNNTPTGDVY